MIGWVRLCILIEIAAGICPLFMSIFKTVFSKRYCEIKINKTKGKKIKLKHSVRLLLSMLSVIQQFIVNSWIL